MDFVIEIAGPIDETTTNSYGSICRQNPHNPFVMYTKTPSADFDCPQFKVPEWTYGAIPEGTVNYVVGWNGATLLNGKHPLMRVTCTMTKGTMIGSQSCVSHTVVRNIIGYLGNVEIFNFTLDKILDLFVCPGWPRLKGHCDNYPIIMYVGIILRSKVQNMEHPGYKQKHSRNKFVPGEDFAYLLYHANNFQRESEQAKITAAELAIKHANELGEQRIEYLKEIIELQTSCMATRGKLAKVQAELVAAQTQSAPVCWEMSHELCNLILATIPADQITGSIKVCQQIDEAE